VAERTRRIHAERTVGDAILADQALASRKVEVFCHGAFRNGTVVGDRGHVDLCVVCADTLQCDFDPETGINPADLGNGAVTYPYAAYKADLLRALTTSFGQGVVREDGAIRLEVNSYHLWAYVLPTFEYRRYVRDDDGDLAWYQGVWLRTDAGREVSLFPRQNVEGFEQQNELTGGGLRRVVRCLKALRRELAAAGVPSAARMPSFLVDGLVHQAPPACFSPSDLVSEVLAVLDFAIRETAYLETCGQWLEINDIRPLFSPNQPWGLQQATDFLVDARTYMGLKQGRRS
jgi:hypothetical protein